MNGQLKLEGVSAGYGGSKPVVNGINLTVAEGELLVLAGPNGSGKTTILKIAAGLLSPLKGKVLINGMDIANLGFRERAALTAFLFQVREGNWPFTVRETVSQANFARRGWLGAETKIDREKVERALEKADIGAFAEYPVTSLSGGELQRVYVARCIAQGSAFLLLDEPDNNLDPKYSYKVLTLVSELVREGRGAIVSLHDLRLASLFAGRIALLSKDGTISAIGSPSEVLTEDKLSSVYEIGRDLAVNLFGAFNESLFQN